MTKNCKEEIRVISSEKIMFELRALTCVLQGLADKLYNKLDPKAEFITKNRTYITRRREVFFLLLLVYFKEPIAVTTRLMFVVAATSVR